MAIRTPIPLLEPRAAYPGGFNLSNYLDLPTVAKTQLVCRSWRDLVDKTVWCKRQTNQRLNSLFPIRNQGDLLNIIDKLLELNKFAVALELMENAPSEWRDDAALHIATGVATSDVPLDQLERALQSAKKIESSLSRRCFLQRLLRRAPESALKSGFIKSCSELLSIYTPTAVYSRLYEGQKREISEFFRRIDKAELHKFLRDEVFLTLKPEEIEALKTSKWDHLIFNDPEIEAYVLKAFIFGKIDRLQVSSLLLFINCRRRDRCQFFQLVAEDGTLNKEAANLLKNSLDNHYTADQFDAFLHSISHLSPQSTQFYLVFGVLYEQILRLPEEVDMDQFRSMFSFHGDVDIKELLNKIHQCSREEAIQLVADSLKNSLNRSQIEHRLVIAGCIQGKITSILQRIIQTNYKFLMHADGNGKGWQCVLPLHLMTPLLKAKFGNRIMRPNPVLGASLSAENFKHPDQRDVLIPCSLFPQSTPLIADDYFAPDLEFYHHDIAYHVPIECANSHRKGWVQVAKKYDPANPEAPLKSRLLYEKLLDREFRSYLFNYGTQSFCVSLEETIDKFNTFLLSFGFSEAECERFDLDVLNCCTSFD